jgi:hypothetical protein
MHDLRTPLLSSTPKKRKRTSHPHHDLLTPAVVVYTLSEGGKRAWEALRRLRPRDFDESVSLLDPHAFAVWLSSL